MLLKKIEPSFPKYINFFNTAYLLLYSNAASAYHFSSPRASGSLYFTDSCVTAISIYCRVT